MGSFSMQAKIDTVARRKKLPVATHPVWTSIGDAEVGLEAGLPQGRPWRRLGRQAGHGRREDRDGAWTGGRRLGDGHELRRSDSRP